MMKIAESGNLLLAWCLAAAGCSDAPDARPARPNILIAIADDLSYPHTGACGCAWTTTPAFDRVAAEGLLFERCYTPNAKSAPSRACLLTGRYSWQLEEAANHIGRWPAGKYPTFVEALAAEGYGAGFTGKGWAPGDPGRTEDGPRRLTGEPWQRRKTSPPASGIARTDYAANFRDFLAAQPPGRPWVFWYGSREPHRPYEFRSGERLGGRTPDEAGRVPAFWPDADTVRYDLLDYAFEVEYFDAHLGRMLAALEEAGELDNTLVVVTSDNGMPFPRCKGSAYEYANHVPLAVMWRAGIRRPGRRVGEPVSFVDVAPTLLCAAGIDAATAGMEWRGTELTDIFDDRPRHERPYVLMGQERHDYGRPRNQGYPTRSILRDGWLYIRNFKPELWPAGDPETGYLNTDGSPTKTLMLDRRRDGRDTLLWQRAFGKRPAEELYRVDADPECMVDLASDPAYAERKRALRDTLFARLREQRDPRIEGRGDVFDAYPFYKPECADFYERCMRGEAGASQTGWVAPTDYESPAGLR